MSKTIIVLSLISLLIGLILITESIVFYDTFANSAFTFAVASVCVFVHIATAYRVNVSDPTHFRIISMDIWSNQDTKWNTYYFIEHKNIIKSSYLNYNLKTDDNWRIVEYDKDSIFQSSRYTTQEDAMKRIMQSIALIKKKKEYIPETKDRKIVKEITVSEEIDKIIL